MALRLVARTCSIKLRGIAVADDVHKLEGIDRLWSVEEARSRQDVLW